MAREVEHCVDAAVQKPDVGGGPRHRGGVGHVQCHNGGSSVTRGSDDLGTMLGLQMR